ncbi:conserved protein of unknown function [Acidithiobacillus ferrivorans]|uniref:Uncharacterized protein n=1 Tax=Acidithiobacillus ferrivorans TaxID=160808 RepID=A0A060UUV4_9PROT|nr:hypothetical protein [Acidithiobacillus ferrivorans]CDQ10523.1 conserved hypothetical protein [Acidithiobacillus ferrivorans]SMH64552.1 conserved protein of unknown function [Acidithiobacillus ferrivorans]
MSKKSTPVPRPAPCWFFSNRFGRRFGPYTDAKEIRAVLSNHVIGKVFEPAIEGITGIIRNETEFVMADAEHNNTVCPGDWLDAEKAKRRGHHAHRSGPVAGIHKPRYWKMWRTPDFGRKVRDTGHGCLEDGESQIRVKLRVCDYAWDDFAPCRTRKSWKHYRDQQWR